MRCGGRVQACRGGARVARRPRLGKKTEGDKDEGEGVAPAVGGNRKMWVGRGQVLTRTAPAPASGLKRWCLIIRERVGPVGVTR